MSKVTDYYDEHMLLHPLWLGSLLLFSVIIIIGISCFIRKKFGKSIQNLYNKLCCKSGSNTKDGRSKSVDYSYPITTYNWAPIFIPSTGVSPNVHKASRSIQTTNTGNSLGVHNYFDHSEQDSIDNHSSSLNDDYTPDRRSSAISISSTTLKTSNNRTVEAARKFFASMRHTSQGNNTNSMDSGEFSLSRLPGHRMMKAARAEKIKSFRTTRFFQSLTSKY